MAIFLAWKSRKNGRGGNFLEVHIQHFPYFRVFRDKNILKNIKFSQTCIAIFFKLEYHACQLAVSAGLGVDEFRFVCMTNFTRLFNGSDLSSRKMIVLVQENYAVLLTAVNYLTFITFVQNVTTKIWEKKS
ncbi:MAG: hypothetical protein LBQ66_10555 [Planctomycetaceae bacterium]|jgi:hypothetical protein|nr:hypothetical protein [Planctomycetaceae bacterium]